MMFKWIKKNVFFIRDEEHIHNHRAKAVDNETVRYIQGDTSSTLHNKTHVLWRCSCGDWLHRSYDGTFKKEQFDLMEEVE